MQSNDLDERSRWVAAMDVQRLSRPREPEDEATRALFVIRVVLDQFALRDGVANILHADPPNDALIGRMLRKLELSISDLCLQRGKHG